MTITASPSAAMARPFALLRTRRPMVKLVLPSLITVVRPCLPTARGARWSPATSPASREVDALDGVIRHHGEAVVLQLEHHRVAGGVVVHLENPSRHRLSAGEVDGDAAQFL